MLLPSRHVSDGYDVITLSKGQFNVVSTVAKSVKIIGAYGFEKDASTSTLLVTSMAIDANSVHVEGIYFSGNVTLGSVKDCIIRRCYLASNLNAKSSCTNTNTIVDQCVVMNDYAIGSSVNYTIKNSTIYSFRATGSFSNKAYILNNVVYYWSDYKPYAIYKNNILGVVTGSCGSSSYSNYVYTYPYTVPSVGEFYYNYFFINSSPGNLYEYALKITFGSSTPNSANYGYWMYDLFGSRDTSVFTYPAPSRTQYGKGQDGTAKGPYGGTGFTKNPAIPRITSSTISDRTDAEGKLNVTIKVSAQ